MQAFAGNDPLNDAPGTHYLRWHRASSSARRSEGAREAGVSRESLYRALSADGNPEFGTVLRVMRALGLQLTVTPAHHEDAA